VVPAHHHILERWHSDQARSGLGVGRTDADDERFLNSGSEDLSAGCVGTGDCEPLLGFEHWGEERWASVDSTGGGGIGDVFNSDYQRYSTLELDATTSSPTQLRTGYLSNTNFSTHLLPTSSFFSTSLDSSGDIGSQANPNTMSEWPNDVSSILELDLEPPWLSTVGEAALADVSKMSWPSANGLPSQFNAEDIGVAALDLPTTALSESITQASLNESSSGNPTPSQIWACDFQDCGRVCKSHKKLK